MSDKQFVLRNVSHAFGAVKVLDDITLEIERSEFIAFVGPSGCGKTTLLNLLSGHMTPTSGSIERYGSPRMVYQEDSLFPWWTVDENISLGLRKVAQNGERKGRIRELLQLIRLEGFGGHYPHQLSGGMRQRVELARALAGDQDTLLMDEPFSALDYLERLRMRQELARILAERSRTVALVTHDIEEAAQLADRVIVLSERPARIRRELRIHAPRPRSVTDPEVVHAAGVILMELGIEGDAEKLGSPLK